jgi:hypothetical protein
MADISARNLFVVGERSIEDVIKERKAKEAAENGITEPKSFLDKLLGR